MTGQRGGKTLSEQVRQQAIAAAKASLDRRAVPEVQTRHTAATPFDELDAYKTIGKIRAASEVMGIANPYFRSHDGRATATTRIDGATYVNFASYDYLGLNSDPRPAAAAKAAIDQYGVSPSASRLVAGERPVHSKLEAQFARHYGTQDAVVFVSGHATNVSTIGELLGDKDLILHDNLIHNSILVGAQLSSASRRSFKHNDMATLRDMLGGNRHRFRNALIAVEGLYSMDGDVAPLRQLVELKREFGCWLLVDEAHALGCVGASGRGSFEQAGIEPSHVDIWMGTLSKTLAATGGYIAGSAALVEILKFGASGFVYSVGLSPPLAAAASVALEIAETEPERVTRLQDNSRLFLDLAKQHGLDTGSAEAFSVIPVMVGNSLVAGKLCERLFEKGINVLPITFPAVPMQGARLRFFLTSEHTHDQIEFAVTTTARELDRLRKEEFAMHLPPEIYDV
jgi:8-amino-7-oxononanoate synthase